MVKACAFCGATGVKVTNEHLLRATWAGEYPMLWEETRQVRETLGKPTVDRVIPRTAFDMPVREVCESCNGGWMNALDTAAERVILDLANGRRADLPAGSQATIQDWATKTALVRTLSDREFHRPVEALAHMGTKHIAPPGVVVQFALCHAHAGYASGRNTDIAISAQPQSAGVTHQGRANFIALGMHRLFIQVGIPDLTKLSRQVVVERLRLSRLAFPETFLVIDSGVVARREFGRGRLTRDESFICSDLVAGQN